MPMIDAKLNEVDAWGGESTQLPPGPYSFRIKSASIESKAEGKNQLVVENEVISSGEMKGKTAKSFFMLDFSKDAPRKRLKSLVLATKVPVDAAGNFNSDNLVGTQYDAEVTHESYESKPDPITGQTTTKTATRIVNEMPFGTNAAKASGKPAVSNSAPVSGQAAPLMPGMAGLTAVE